MADDDLVLPYVLDLTHGVAVNASQWQSMSAKEQSRFVEDVVSAGIDEAQGLPDEGRGRRIVCPICQQRAVARRGRHGVRAHFAHASGAGEGCELAKGGISQARQRALRYQGQRESAEHLALKSEVAHWLSRTPGVVGVAIEQRVRSSFEERWRQPDVSCVYRGRPIAIEIQRSAEYMRVIIERDRFYKAEGWLVIYLFSPPADRGVMAADEGFLTGTGGFFVLDDTARAACAERDELVLRFRQNRKRGELSCTMDELVYPEPGAPQNFRPRPYPRAIPAPNRLLDPKTAAKHLIEAARQETAGEIAFKRRHELARGAYQEFRRAAVLDTSFPEPGEWKALADFLTRV